MISLHVWPRTKTLWIVRRNWCFRFANKLMRHMINWSNFATMTTLLGPGGTTLTLMIMVELWGAGGDVFQDSTMSNQKSTGQHGQKRSTRKIILAKSAINALIIAIHIQFAFVFSVFMNNDHPKVRIHSTVLAALHFTDHHHLDMRKNLFLWRSGPYSRPLMRCLDARLRSLQEEYRKTT